MPRPDGRSPWSLVQAAAACAMLLGSARAHAQTGNIPRSPTPRIQPFVDGTLGIFAFPAGGVGFGVGGGLRFELGRYAQARFRGALLYVPELIALAHSTHDAPIYAFQEASIRAESTIRIRTGSGAGAFLGAGCYLAAVLAYTDSQGSSFPPLMPRTQRFVVAPVFAPVAEIGAAFGPGGAFELSLEAAIWPFVTPPFEGAIDLELIFAYTPARMPRRER